MQILKYILIAIDIIVAFALIIITLKQGKEDQGLSSTITGGASNNFLDKNKGRTREGRLKKWTIILGITFAVLTMVLSIVYVL